MKNKKLLILFCIPLIIAVMVLPLCSFTTTVYEDYITYEPSIRTDVGYVYTTANNSSYYGTISNYNRVLIPNSGEEMPSFSSSDIKFNASSYLIISSPSFRINYREFNASLNPSTLTKLPDNTDLLTLNMYCSGSTTSGNTLAFTGVVDYYGFINNETARYNTINFNSSEMATDRFSAVVTCDYSSIVGDDIVTSTYTDTYTFTAEDYSIPLTYFINALYSSIPNLSSGRVSITHLRIAYSNMDLGGFYRPIYSTNFSSTDRIIDSSSVDSYAIKEIYDIAFSQGYNSGISNAESVWQSFPNFLKNTVGAFLDMNITPNITISGILSVIISIGLVILFLRLFAGG